MAISYIGSATGTNSIASMPAHQAGDLLLFFAFRDGNVTAPSLPSDYTNILTGSDSDLVSSCRVGYKIAASGSETSGTWTNATGLICHVYRGVDQTTPIGGSKAYSYFDTGNNTVNYRVITMTDTSGASWVAGFAGHAATNTSLETAPTGMTNRTNVVDATDEAAGHDTNGGVTSWTTKTVSVGGTTASWCSAVVEILANPTITVTQNSTFTNSNSFYNGSLNLKATQSSTFTNSNSFYSGSLSLKATQSSTFINSNSFYGGTVTLNGLVISQDSHFTNSNSFYSGILNLKVTQDSIFANSNSFYSGSISLGSVTVAQDSSFTNSNSFYSGNLSLKVIQDSVFTNSNSFYSGSLRLKVTQDSVFTNSNSFYSGSLNLQVFQGSIFTNSNSFYSGSISTGSVVVTQDSVFTNSNSFYSGSLNLQGFQGSIFTNSNSFYNGSLNLQVFQSSIFANSNSFYSGSLSLKVIQDSPFTNSNSFYGGTVTLGGIVLFQDSIVTNSNSFYNGNLNLKVTQSSIFTNSNSFYSGSLNLKVIQDSIFTNSNSFYSGTIALGAVTVTQGTTFTNSNNFYSGNIFLISDSLLQTSIFTNSNSFYSGIVLPGLVRIIQLRSCENDSLLYLNGKIIGGEEGMYANLVTKSDYKSYMSINSTNQDAIIDFLIPKVSNFVKSYCRRTFVDYVANAKIENFNGGVPFFVVQEQPIIAIQDLFYSSDYGQTYTALTQYVDYIVDDANVIYPIASSEFRYSMRGYRLVYFAGYEVLPADLTLAIYDLLSYYIKNDVAVNAIKRTNTTSMQIEYITDTALPSNIKRVLDMYISDYN